MNQINKELIDFANNVKALREKTGLSLRALAEELGISKSALQQYEAALSDPAMTVVRRIAAYFDVDVDWLIGVQANKHSKDIKKMA